MKVERSHKWYYEQGVWKEKNNARQVGIHLWCQ